MIVMSLEKGFDLGIEVRKQRGQGAGSFDFEEARNPVSMAMQIAALVG